MDIKKRLVVLRDRFVDWKEIREGKRINAACGPDFLFGCSATSRSIRSPRRGKTNFPDPSVVPPVAIPRKGQPRNPNLVAYDQQLQPIIPVKRYSDSEFEIAHMYYTAKEGSRLDVLLQVPDPSGS